MSSDAVSDGNPSELSLVFGSSSGRAAQNSAYSPPTGGQRPLKVEFYNDMLPGSSKRRTIPAPWIDCQGCAWRHYPSTNRGRWYIATICVSCGAVLGDSVPISRAG